MKIAVMGYGTIGSGVVEVLEINKEKIAKRAGEPIEVKYVLDLREFPGTPIENKIVHDYKVIAEDPEIGIVVETMGGVEPAFTFVKAMLEAGKQVATSNKNLVAAKGAELIKVARDHGVNFQFEASVGGGIPIIRPLNKCLTADEIEEITGILNGTTNYILTKMSQEGSSYEDVLKEAQDLGLVDAMGNYYDALNYAASSGGIPGENVPVKTYTNGMSLKGILAGEAENVSKIMAREMAENMTKVLSESSVPSVK